MEVFRVDTDTERFSSQDEPGGFNGLLLVFQIINFLSEFLDFDTNGLRYLGPRGLVDKHPVGFI